MLHQPTFPYPYNQMVHAEDEIIFRCLINPRDVIYAYVLKIKDYDTGDTVCIITNLNSVYDQVNPEPIIVGKANQQSWLEIPVENNINIENGKSYVWQLTLYDKIDNKTSIPLLEKQNDNTRSLATDYIAFSSTDSEISTSKDIINVMIDTNGNIYSVIAASTQNIFKLELVSGELDNKTKRMFKLYGFSELQTYEYYFKTGDKAEIDFQLPNVITSNSIDVSVSYYQEQNILPQFYCFNLYSDNVLVDTTGNIASVDISYSYDKLIAGNDYVLELIILDDERNETILTRNFSVKYNYYQTIFIPKATLNRSKHCINVDFSEMIVIPGEVENNWNIAFSTYKNSTTQDLPTSPNAVSLEENQNIYWNKQNNKPLSLENTMQVIHWHGHDSFCGKIIEKIDEENSLRNIVAGYDGSNFYYKFGTSEKVYNSPYKTVANTAIDSSGDVVIDENTLYILKDSDELQDSDTILYNDLVGRYWWNIIISEDEVLFLQNENYIDTVVNT